MRFGRVPLDLAIPSLTCFCFRSKNPAIWAEWHNTRGVSLHGYVQ